MTRAEYIKKHAVELVKLEKKMQRLSERYRDPNASRKQVQKLNVEMNWTGMEIAKTEERLAFALGYLIPENAQETYRPSEWHEYPGIRPELESTKFDV